LCTKERPMSDADRIQRWRQRMREEGKEPMSLWLSRDTKLRLEDLASVWHCSPSDLVEQALMQFHPGSPSVPGTVTGTEQLQALVTDAVRAVLPVFKRQILQELQPVYASSPSVPVRDGNVTDTQSPEAPVSTAPIPTYEADHGHGILTEPTPQRTEG